LACKAIRKRCAGDHEVFTFDDGPAPTTAQAERAQGRMLRATFFVIGVNATSMAATVKREAQEGIRSVPLLQHPAKTLRLCLEAAKADIERDRRRGQGRLWRISLKVARALFPLSRLC